ncbi:CGNR zinc finger domain-containing protein [Actinacidiphila acididurans]|uniref:CGNR zinc finger domain-containing protein n=1 Tax=Actinacidiphila acididurans TaxID=2784346 RepID=A0ABS2TP81_9ACTN|nr:CGNR zinc finger domain-containing protein [Actinacidiphila acididurans]MBM9505146.1 CGNR zinc finger domain-containing protein [Actinacidiphila acididurans]
MNATVSAGTVPVRFRQGAGRLCLDFVRTLRYRGTPEVTEELTGPEALVAWVTQCGPFDGTLRVPLPVQSEVDEAKALREAVHALLMASLGDGGPAAVGASARNRLNRAAAAAVPTPRLAPSGELRWLADDPVPATLSLVARDALELAASPALLARVHACASPACGALFLDHSRPGTRRWCSMDICGNQAKRAGLRARA